MNIQITTPMNMLDYDKDDVVVLKKRNSIMRFQHTEVGRQITLIKDEGTTSTIVNCILPKTVKDAIPHLKKILNINTNLKKTTVTIFKFLEERNVRKYRYVVCIVRPKLGKNTVIAISHVFSLGLLPTKSQISEFN